MYYFIEPMHEDDIPQVQAVESQSFTTPWSANTYRRELRNQAACRYIVARASPHPPEAAGGEQRQRRGLLASLFGTLFGQGESSRSEPVVGYGGVWLTVDDAHITTIAVDPDHRGKGVGELLLNGLIDHAYELGARMLTLEVRVSNYTAQKLYLKYGFQPGGTRPRYYTDNNEDALIMWTDDINTPTYQERINELRRRLFARLQRESEASRAPGA